MTYKSGYLIKLRNRFIQHSPYRQMWFTNDVMYKKNTLFGSKLYHRHQQVTSSLHSRPVCQSRSFNDIKALSSHQNYFRFEIKCGNASFVYEKSMNRDVNNWKLGSVIGFSLTFLSLKRKRKTIFLPFDQRNKKYEKFHKCFTWMIFALCERWWRTKLSAFRHEHLTRAQFQLWL